LLPKLNILLPASYFCTVEQLRYKPMVLMDVPVSNTESLALAEVIAYSEESRYSDATPSVFKLSELGQLYANCLEKHNVKKPAKLENICIR